MDYTVNDLVTTIYDEGKGSKGSIWMQMSDGAEFDSDLMLWSDEDIEAVQTDESFLDDEKNFQMALENAVKRED